MRVTSTPCNQAEGLEVVSGEASPAPRPCWWDGQISTDTSPQSPAQALAGHSDTAPAQPLLCVDVNTPSPAP